MDVRILAIGDVVGKPGRQVIERHVKTLRKDLAADLCIANAENVAGGSGLTIETVDKLFASGVDFLTSGDHIWRRREIYPRLESDRRILRPANYPPEAPGVGAGTVATANGVTVGVINLVGRVFMKPVDCPFKAADRAVKKLAEEAKVIVVDMHAEATSEKVAMGWYLDGRVSAVFGTHTHIQTCDEIVLPKGTAYITELGMTGPYASVIGREVEPVIKSLVVGMPAEFEVATEDVRIAGALFTIDADTGKARGVERVCFRMKAEP